MRKTKPKARQMTAAQRRDSQIRRAVRRALGARTFQRITSQGQDVSVAEQIRRHETATAALERLRTGTAQPQDFDDINELVQLTGGLCAYIEDRHEASAGIADVNHAATAMRLMKQRYRQYGTLRFDGAGLEHVRIVLDMHGQLLEQINNDQLARAERWVQARLELAEKGGV